MKKKWIIASVLVLFGIFMIANLLFNVSAPQDFIEIEEGKLKKNKGLTLLSGEKYTYLIKSEENEEYTNSTLEFNIKWFYGGCLNILIFESETGVCLDSDGTDKSNSNSTLSHPQVVFFKPWMLALEEDWEWEIKYKNKLSNTSIMEYYYEVISMEEIYGREAFVVSMSDGNINSTSWIDKEKRVLLREIGEEYELEIIEAPFPLEK